MKRGRQTLVATVVAASLLLLPSASAYWTAGGTGAGDGSTDGGLALVVGPGTPTTAVHPGGTAGVAVVLTNPNPYVVHVGALAPHTSQGTGGFAVDPAHGGCDVGALSYITQTNAAAGWDVPARTGGSDGELVVDLDGALAMSASAAQACQGATFTVYLQVTS